MRLIFTLLSIQLLAAQCLAVDFTKLSRTEMVTTTYEAETKCYVDISLFLNTKNVYQDNIFLRLTYVIGNDTLNDNMWVDGNYNGVVKQLFLDQGERITAFITLNNANIEEIDGLEGSFNVLRNLNYDVTTDQGKNSFIGSVWKSDQTPLFRVNVRDSTSKIFRLKFALNENYEFDKLYFKLKVISPVEGIIMVKREITINENAMVNLSRKEFTVDLDEIKMEKPGSYYFQVMQNMDYLRLNGVEGVSYEIAPQ